MRQFVLIEFPRCEVIRIANNLSSCAQPVLRARSRSELWWQDDPRSRIGPFDDESFLVGLKNEAMELFLPDHFTL